MSEYSTDALLSNARGARDLAAAHTIHRGYPVLLAHTTRTIMERLGQQLSEWKETAHWAPGPDGQPPERQIAGQFRERLSRGKGPRSRQMGYTDSPGISLQVGTIDGMAVTVAVEFVHPEWRLSYKVFLMDGIKPVTQEGRVSGRSRANEVRDNAISNIFAKYPDNFSHCVDKKPKNAVLRLDTPIDLTTCANALAKNFAELDGSQFEEAVYHVADEVHRFSLAVASACDAA